MTFASLRAKQVEWLNALADAIEQSRPVSSHDRQVAAAIVRLHAERLPTTPTRKRGQAPRVDHRELAMHYAALVNGKGVRPAVAKAGLAEANEITVEAVGAIIKTYGRSALRAIPRNPKVRKK